jgi:hypothetical protein
MARHNTKRKGQPKTFRAGRVCRKRGCSQRLSVYNSGLFCYLHISESFV